MNPTKKRETKKFKSDKISELESQLKRLAADFDNYRKHTETEKRELFAMAQANTLLELAPVLDNFRRATEHLPNDLAGNNWVTGILYIEKQVEQIFENFGVTKIATVGQPFNPQRHEAVETEPSDSVPTDHVIGELESGYMLGEKVLKPAKVKVSSGTKPRPDDD